MKRFVLLLAALLCLLAIPGFAEMVETLPVPENCQVKENYIGQNSVSYLDYSNMADPFRGWVGEKTAMFMEDTPEGRVFAGYVRQVDGRWLRTESSPLPEGAVCQAYITKEDLFYFSFRRRMALPRRTAHRTRRFLRLRGRLPAGEPGGLGLWHMHL